MLSRIIDIFGRKYFPVFMIFLKNKYVFIIWTVYSEEVIKNLAFNFPEIFEFWNFSGLQPECQGINCLIERYILNK